jgi:DNA end-binding protein Ku
MAARSFASVTIAFGLVSIPLDVFSAEISASRLSFNLLHAKDGARVTIPASCRRGATIGRRSIVLFLEIDRDRCSRYG